MASYTLTNTSGNDIAFEGGVVHQGKSLTVAYMTPEIVSQVTAGHLTCVPAAPTTMTSPYLYNGTNVNSPAISNGQLSLVPSADEASTNANFAAVAVALQILDGRVSALENLSSLT